jgi:hypothetical protein
MCSMDIVLFSSFIRSTILRINYIIHNSLYALLFFLPLLILPTTSLGQFSTRITPGLLFLYTFEEGQLDSSASSTVDISSKNTLGPINLNTAASSLFTDRPGLSLNGNPNVQAGISQKNISSLLVSIESTEEWTMESWISPLNFNPTDTIWGVGSWNSPPKMNVPCRTNPSTFNIYQDGFNFGGQQACQLSSGKSCTSVKEIVSDNISSSINPLIHLVVTWTNTSVLVYLNGMTTRGASLINVQGWYSQWIASHRLYLAPDLDAAESGVTWEGSIYLLSMYNHALNFTEVNTNYLAGIPLALPQPYPKIQQVVGPQDVETTYQIVLNGTDVDTSYSSLSLFLTLLPTVGSFQLFDRDSWRTLVSDSLPCTLGMGTPITFKYTPPTGLIGMGIANFEFKVYDGYSYGPAGIVYFSISATPIPLNKNYTAYIGIFLPITLQASNAVSVFIQVNGYITSLPTHGILYQTSDGVTPLGSALISSQLPILLINPNATVLYQSCSINGSSACFINDSFNFQLALPSISLVNKEHIGCIQLTICNRLFSISSTYSVPPLGSVSLSLKGNSLLQGEFFSAVINSVPSGGVLLKALYTSPIVIGDTVSVGSDLIYQRNLPNPSSSTSFSSLSSSTASLAPTPDSFTFSIVSTSSPSLYSQQSLILLEVSTSAFSSRASGPLALYLFEDGIQSGGTSQQAVDTSELHLGGILNFQTNVDTVLPTWIPITGGLQFNGPPVNTSTPTGLASSLLAGAALYKRLISTQAVTLEAWVEWNTLSFPSPFGSIVSLGSGTASDAVIEIAQKGAWVVSASNVHITQTWNRPPSVSVDASVVRTHLVLTASSNSGIFFYADNVLQHTVQSPPPPLFPSLTTDQTMQLLVGGVSLPGSYSTPSSIGPIAWNSIIKMVAIYDRVLTRTEITNNFNAGLPNTPPQSIPSYQNVLVNEYTQLSLLSSFISFTPLQYNTPTTFPLSESISSLVLTTFVWSLPSVGTLSVSPNGILPNQSLSNSDLPFQFDTTRSKFYWSAPSQFSSDAHYIGLSSASSWSWAVVDGWRLSTRYANVGINVLPITVPPLVKSVSAQGYDITPILIQLLGQDIDPNPPISSPISAFWLQTLPSQGVLYASLNGTGRMDINTVYLSQNITLPFRVSSGLLPLYYVSTPQFSTPSSTIVLTPTTDRFSYLSEVKNTISNSSSPATAIITLRNHLWSGGNSGINTFYIVPQPAYDSVVTSVSIQLKGGLISNTGASTWQNTMLNSNSIGFNSVSLTLPVVLSELNTCVLFSSLVLPTGSVLYGLTADLISPPSAITLYIQQWLPQFTSGWSLLSSVAVNIPGGLNQSPWRLMLSASQWWEIGGTNDPLGISRIAVCVKGSDSLPFRSSSNSTFSPLYKFTFSGSAQGATITAPTQINRRYDIQMLVWTSVSINQIDTSGWGITKSMVLPSNTVSPISPLKIVESISFVLLRIPSIGNITSAVDGSVLCTSAPCLLSSRVAGSVLYSRDLSQLDSIKQLASDSFTYVTQSTISTSSSGTAIMQSDSTEVTLAMSPPPSPPLFLEQFQVVQTYTVQAYSSKSYPFSIQLDNNTILASAKGYDVTLSIYPPTAGFNLPNAALPYIASSLIFLSGSPNNNVIVKLIAPDIVTLNTIFMNMQIQPLYVGVYNFTAVVSVHSITPSGYLPTIFSSTTAIVEFVVNNSPNDIPDGSSSSSGGLFNFLNSSKLVYIWIILIMLGILILCVCWCKCRSRKRNKLTVKTKQRENEKKKKKKNKKMATKKKNRKVIIFLLLLVT